MSFRPSLEDVEQDGIRFLTDPSARADGVLVAFTDRRGGVSESPYDSLNLALRVGDEPHDVEENRKRIASAAGFDAGRLALARQVHGVNVMVAPPHSTGVVGEADALVTSHSGQVIGILTADCAPVVLAGEEGVAVVHAGWRGLVAGVVERGVAAVAPVRAAWVGPSIHACCYEVGAEVVDGFRSRGLPVAGDRRVDPGRAACTALRRAGVEQVAATTECTSCDARYFSYRRDGVTGRQGAFVAIV